MHGAKRILEAMVVCSAMLLPACSLMPASLSTHRCIAASKIRPGMTESKVVALVGKPYGLDVSRGQMTYIWMDEAAGRHVYVHFGRPASGSKRDMGQAVVQSTSGWCGAGNSFEFPMTTDEHSTQATSPQPQSAD
jgi:hypothetical protein